MKADIQELSVVKYENKNKHWYVAQEINIKKLWYLLS